VPVDDTAPSIYLAAAPSPPKDETEPASQQVDKSLPKPPAPSKSDKKSGGVSQPSPQESKKELKKEETSKPKEKEKEKSKTVATERPAAGSRNETRVCSIHCP
jgi:2-oxoglutarate dehydrogenase E2 component (dihydrolipoamide succinyltransferase)